MSEEEGPSGEMGKLAAGVVVLVCICLGSGLGVGVLYWSFKDDIQRKEQEVFDEALAEVLGEAKSYPAVGRYDEDASYEDKVYMNQVESGVLYAAMGSAVGYQSEIKVLVAVRTSVSNVPVGDDPVIDRMTVVSCQETPGLGQNITSVEKDISVWGALAGEESAPRRPRFQEQFSGKRLSDLVVETRPDTDKIRAETGATITSKAATEAVRSAVQKIIEKTAGTYRK